MVKNKKGGRNHRKQASKHAKPTVQAKIRLAKEEDETYEADQEVVDEYEGDEEIEPEESEEEEEEH